MFRSLSCNVNVSVSEKPVVIARTDLGERTEQGNPWTEYGQCVTHLVYVVILKTRNTIVTPRGKE
jgi:hypothetical protein